MANGTGCGRCATLCDAVGSPGLLCIDPRPCWSCGTSPESERKQWMEPSSEVFCSNCWQTAPGWQAAHGTQNIPSRVCEADAPGATLPDPSGWQHLQIEPLLPPDPDAIGSRHWLQLGQRVELREWALDGWVWPQWKGASSPAVMASHGWRYHSQMVIPAPLALPDPNAERMWAATKGLSA